MHFDNRFINKLPADPEPRNYQRSVLGACFSRVRPTPVASPRVLATSREMVNELGLDESTTETIDFAAVMSGNKLWTGMEPYAACYGGHQFGNWAGQLGDGRAITLGEVVTKGQRRWELQLKGAGPTPYSRRADGRAVMRSSVREFLCSEAMYHLGVPTTRALALVATGDDVVRDMFYDGRAAPEPGAIVCRVAPSFLRFGNFELPTLRGDTALLRRLTDYTIATHFPYLGKPSSDTYLRWISDVCERTAEMIVHWMRVGFVHGVMNTDNMSVHGLTIDYGPYGWLEGYDPSWTPNTTDQPGRRYCFGNQPQIAHWNVARLAAAVFPLIGDYRALEEALAAYTQSFDTGHRAMMAAKLGLIANTQADDPLVSALTEVLQLAEIDMTLFFRALSGLPETPSNDELLAPVNNALYTPEALSDAHRERWLDWLRRYQHRIKNEQTNRDARTIQMNRVNPKYVLRNYLAQLAIDDAERGDGTGTTKLLEVLRHPYSDQPEHQSYAAKRPEWARHRPGCGALSCSS